jgi:hypothetical protein
LRKSQSLVIYVEVFYNCSNRLCKVIQFRAGFSGAKNFGETAAGIWNRKHLVGRAYLDEDGDPALDAVFVVKGGMNGDNLGTSVVFGPSLSISSSRSCARCVDVAWRLAVFPRGSVSFSARIPLERRRFFAVVRRL